MIRVLSLVSLFAMACSETEPSGPFVNSRVERKVIPFGNFADVDLLIVVDSSPAMAPFRTSLVEQAAQIAAVFETAPLGMPSVHIGVVTSDLGAEGVAVPGCSGDGDDGRLRSHSTIQGAFISDVAAADGSRVRNYQGSLADALGNLLDVGTSGCPYSRPFAAAERALDNTIANAGFLRPDAYLGVVFITAQDDCSFTDAGFLAGSTSTDTARCVAMASLLPAIDGFVADLKARRTDPSKVMVGGVIAPTAPTCAAQTAPRLHSFLQMFPNRQAEASICGTSYVDAFAMLTQLLRSVIGIPCWESQLFDEDPATPGIQPACSGSYVLADGADGLLPLCADGNELCWRLIEDEQFCPASNLALEIETHGRTIPVGAVATVECLVAD